MAESEVTPNGNRMLMETIRNYRAIYDKGCHEYKDQRVKKNAWQAVANTLKIDVASAQQRYNNIRTNFSKYIKSLKGKSGSGRDDLVNIRPNYKYLRWLCSHTKHRQTRSVEGAPIWFAFRAFLSTSATHRRYTGDRPGLDWDRSPNTVGCNRRLCRRYAGDIWEPGVTRDPSLFIPEGKTWVWWTSIKEKPLTLTGFRTILPKRNSKRF